MLASIFVWAGSDIAMKRVVPFIGPFDFIVVRYPSSAIVLFAMVFCTNRPLAQAAGMVFILLGLWTVNRPAKRARPT